MKYKDLPKGLKVVVVIIALIFPMFVYLCVFPIMILEQHNELHAGSMGHFMLYAVGITLLFLYNHTVLIKLMREDCVFTMDFVMMFTIIACVFPCLYHMPETLWSAIEYITEPLFRLG